MGAHECLSHNMSFSDQPVSTVALVLGGTATAAALVAVPATAAWAKPKRLDYPFTLGVASGDPEPTAVVLWTRLAPKPFDGGHGMRGLDEVDVRWEVATDEGMSNVVKQGNDPDLRRLGPLGARRGQGARAGARVLLPVRGRRARQPGRPHPHRARAGRVVAGLTFASVSCQAYDYGYFTSYPHIVADDPDFVMHLGDYVYEYGMSATAGNRGTKVPEVVQRAPKTLREWRATHALYKQDPDLQEAHRLLPFVVTWDDHEYWNDYAGGSPNPADGGPSAERAASYQAYWEHLPLRAAARFKSGEIRLYRRLAFGSLLQVDMVDGRQFRSVPPCGWGEAQACEAAYDPAITMLGHRAGAVAVRRPRLGSHVERLRQQRDDGAARPRRRPRRPALERRVGRLPRRAQQAARPGRASATSATRCS